ncbi:putative ATPase [Chryseobacterium ginsenosidimutans]|uniref:ATP-binding protein n=1 Tax=Chryseobacterium ginsenosidimutans TaxID=687846 RepID=UPI00216A2EB3|nr:ATP-binding protein [Chryseobacterium ginsenosidimutans]MCS3870687.1 putative ATPase [Chryseobacterium ginsenosidimutans]
MLQFDRIERQDILKAIKWYSNNKFIDDNSSLYSFVYENEIYPLRTIALQAISKEYNDVDFLYDLMDVLSLFERLEFIVERRNDIWKLSCTVPYTNKSSYDLLKKKNIVYGYKKDGQYKKNDLILIVEGFVVRAIVQIKSEQLITAANGDNQIRDLMLEHALLKTDFYMMEVEFYELNSAQTFTYEVAQQIMKIQSFPIQIKSENFWHNRNVVINEIHFSAAPRGFDRLTYSTKYPVIIYRKSNWNDYGYSTTFNFDLYYSPNFKIDIGTIKIGNDIDKNIDLPVNFEMLEGNHFSLGADIDYYEKLTEIFPVIFRDILKALNDVANDRSILNKYYELEIFQKSLLRSSESEYILENLSKILTDRIRDISYDFTFKCRVGNAFNDHEVKFIIEDSKSTSSRFYCIVGKNATGKTKYLSNLANKLADNNEVGEFIPNRPNFVKVIAASFSYFDKFKLPGKQDTNYEFIGIKDDNGTINQDFNSSKIWQSYKRIAKDPIKSELWYKCIKSSLETDYLDFSLSELRNVSQRKKFIALTENIFSSGQNIIFQFITRFIECIEENSILIFDEPETHLHPNITGRLIRTIDFILKHYKSYCILATHSPIVVQEIQSKYIRIFDRIENSPLIYQPVIECFGENLSEISNSIFKVDEEKELYKTQLDELVNQNKSFNEINDLFEHGLSLNARIYLLSKIKN